MKAMTLSIIALIFLIGASVAGPEVEVQLGLGTAAVQELSSAPYFPLMGQTKISLEVNKIGLEVRGHGISYRTYGSAGDRVLEYSALSGLSYSIDRWLTVAAGAGYHWHNAEERSLMIYGAAEFNINDLQAVEPFLTVSLEGDARPIGGGVFFSVRMN